MAELHTCAEVADRYGVKIITVWSWIRKKKAARNQTWPRLPASAMPTSKNLRTPAAPSRLHNHSTTTPVP